MKKIIIIAIALYSCSSKSNNLQEMNKAFNQKLKTQDSLLQIEYKMNKDFQFYMDMYNAGGGEKYLDSAKQIDLKILSFRKN